MRADALAHRDRGAGRGRRAGLGLLHAAELQRAERGEAAGGKTGPAQEGAAIEPVARLIGERGGEAAAASLTFCFLDQHEVSPFLSSGNG